MVVRGNPDTNGGGAGVPATGVAVRLLRGRRNLTLDQLADSTGISKSHLSRFERGQKSVSVAALIRIAKALGTSVSSLLGEQSRQDDIHLVRAGDTDRRQQRKGYGFVSLARADAGNGPDVFRVDLERNAVVADHAYHSGEEAVLVLSGSIVIEFLSETVVMHAGDYAQFCGLAQHTIRGVDDHSQLFIVITPGA